MGNSTGYGYVNARIHGMRRFFLQQSAYEKILSLKSISEFIEFLRSTPYKNILESELLYRDDIALINRALTNYLITQCTKILKFTKGEPHQLFQLLFWRKEIENVKLLSYRLIASNTDLKNWKDTLILINGYSSADIEVLASINTLETLQNWLATRQSPLVEAVRSLRRYPEELLAELVEPTFDRYYFNHIATTLKSLRNTKAVRVFKEMISAEIEFKNIRTALRLLTRAARDRIPPKLRIPDFFILNEADTRVAKLIHAFQTGNTDEVYAICRRSRYGKLLPIISLKDAFRTQGETIDLEMEAHFVRNQIRSTKKNFQGIGLGLAFYWQLAAEIRNLRFLSQVVVSDYPREDARRFLIIV